MKTFLIASILISTTISLKVSNDSLPICIRHSTSKSSLHLPFSRNLSLKASLLQEPVDEEMTREVLKNYSQETKNPDMEDIIDCVCRAFDMSLSVLQSKSRKRTIVSARNTAFYMARKYTSLSLKDIGNQFNRRHSTVLKGITNVEREINRDSNLGHQVLRIMDQLVQ